MEPTTPPTTLRTPIDDEIPGLLAALAASSESLAGFARERGLSSWKLYKARRKHEGSARATTVFEPVRIVGAAEAPVPPSIEMEHSSGHRLHVPVGFDAATLRRLVEVLESC